MKAQTGDRVTFWSLEKNSKHDGQIAVVKIVNKPTVGFPNKETYGILFEDGAHFGAGEDECFPVENEKIG